MRSLVRKVQSSKEKDKAATALKAAVQFMDRLATKGVIHRNKAANTKSKLTKFVSGLK